jgi:hypothetical protein
MKKRDYNEIAKLVVKTYREDGSISLHGLIKIAIKTCLQAKRDIDIIKLQDAIEKLLDAKDRQAGLLKEDI